MILKEVILEVLNSKYATKRDLLDFCEELIVLIQEQDEEEVEEEEYEPTPKDKRLKLRDDRDDKDTEFLTDEEVDYEKDERGFYYLK